jgi:hypothetical protein
MPSIDHTARVLRLLMQPVPGNIPEGEPGNNPLITGGNVFQRFECIVCESVSVRPDQAISTIPKFHGVGDYLAIAGDDVVRTIFGDLDFHAFLIYHFITGNKDNLMYFIAFGIKAV